jgi:NarL family two-component system response regulator LiaR
MEAEPMDKIGVLIVDDHAVVRQGLHTLLELQEVIEVVGEAANGREAIDQTAELLPDVVLMDLVMPEIDGIEATRKIKAACPSTQVIVLTSFSDNEQVFPAIKAGALSYLLKNVSPGDLVRAVQAASRGEAQLDPEIAKKLMEEVSSGSKQQSSEALTERELGVLQLIAKGQSNRAIGEELVISEKTVKTHVGNILSKLYLADRTQAAIFALREGLASEQ